MEEKERSVFWIVAALMIIVALFGWAFAAAGYAHDAEGWREGGTDVLPTGMDGRPDLSRRRNKSAAMADFVTNAIQQLSNIPAVVSFTFKDRIWLPIVVGILEVLLIGGGFGMKKLEKELSSPAKRPRSRG